MSKNLKITLSIIVIAVIVIAVCWHAAHRGGAAMTVAAGGYPAAGDATDMDIATASPSDGSIAPVTASSSIQSDLNSIDAEMGGLNGDNSGVDQSMQTQGQ